MPLEIRELVIRAQVDESQGPQGSGQERPALTDEEQAALVKACVEQVMQIIKDKEER